MEQDTSIATLTVLVDNVMFFSTSCYRHKDLMVKMTPI
jgi:hypothetical protein